MVKRCAALACFLILSAHLHAQEYGLFNTKTLFDAFENPAQPAFVLDSSRKYASNFFLPYFNVNAANKGDSRFSLRTLINDGVFDASKVPIGDRQRNKVYQDANIYVFAFRIFQSYKAHQEIGFSWQMRADGFADYSNETLVVFDNYRRFYGGDSGTAANGLFNGNGYGQSYHQFSINYRENVTKRLAFGAKLSLLSGITYNQGEITSSSLNIDPVSQQLRIGLSGTYRSNFLRAKELSAHNLFPDFKNPGISLGMGTSYKAKSGIMLMGNIKDLGFIRWNSKSHDILVNDVVTMDPDEPQGNAVLEKKLEDTFLKADQRHSFYSATNAKADILVSRQFDWYTPGFIASKNLFYAGGDLVLVNTFKYQEASFSLSPGYNLNGFAMLGTQLMYQTPNFEFFAGTDNLLKTASIKQKATVMSGYTGASAYMGISIKFGYVVEHPQNSSYMPGLDGDREGGFFSRLFSVFKKRKD